MGTPGPRRKWDVSSWRVHPGLGAGEAPFADSQMKREERGGLGGGKLLPCDHLQQLPVDLALFLSDGLWGKQQPTGFQQNTAERGGRRVKIEIPVVEALLGALRCSAW